jgi:hypothetical protein
MSGTYDYELLVFSQVLFIHRFNLDPANVVLVINI